MKIVALQAENIKRLVAVEIKPDGNMVQITGKNGAGKTSILDSIWWALSGASNIQKAPIRKGQKSARIRLDLGEIVVTRTFEAAEGDGPTTSSITVTSATGSKFRTPQTMLDGLLGHLTFDPLEFARMAPRDQFLALRRFAPDVNFEAIDEANQKDYDERTAVNRDAHHARINAKEIEIPLNEQKLERVDESALVDELTKASEHNSNISTRAERREQLAVQYTQHKKTAADYRVQADALMKRADEAEQRADEIQTRLTNAPELPQSIDVSHIQTQITEAQAVNAKVARKERHQALLAEAGRLGKVSDEITGRMENREADKRAKIAKAKMPVEGLSFGKGSIMFNDLPFNQASDAEQLRVSLAIAMALNPDLRVLRIRDGSLLDEESLETVSRMAKDQDYQVWIERVESSGQVGFVIEGGRLKQAHT